MTQADSVKKLGKGEFYKCPLPHEYSKHKQVLFRDFDSHFRIFSDHEEHLAVVQAHEDIFWNLRLVASEKGSLGEADLHRISLEAWFEAVKQCAGKVVQVVKK